ncbi:hypothetical protein EHM69_02610 [candidate division KSB1 bacterium]|nr:MAG: hypothetical protein EHM69_02610 [candidate division KSB1 bacterium]
MTKIQKIILLIYTTGLLLLLLIIVPLNAYRVGRGENIRDADKDKWGTIWDPYYRSGNTGFYRPDKERLLLSVGSWTIICCVTFVLIGLKQK